MILPLEAQMQGFVLAVGVGAALGLIYDIFRIFRVLMQSPASHVFWLDIFYLALAALVTFLLAVGVSFGEVRYYIMLGEAAGFCAYYFTIGMISIRIAGLVKKVLNLCVFHPARSVISWLNTIFGRLGERIASLMKKIFGKYKNRLKQHNKVVYNSAVHNRKRKSVKQRGIHK